MSFEKGFNVDLDNEELLHNWLFRAETTWADLEELLIKSLVHEDDA